MTAHSPSSRICSTSHTIVARAHSVRNRLMIASRPGSGSVHPLVMDGLFRIHRGQAVDVRRIEAADPSRNDDRGRRHVVVAGSADACTPATARPDGSAIFAKLASQAMAAGEEHAIDLPPGTVSAQAWPG